MANLKEWLIEAANGEEIIAVVIGELGWGDYKKEKVPNYDEQPKNKVLSWQEAIKWIDYEFYSGHGSPRCNAITAWTKNWVFFIVQYDGATSLCSVPRNPIDHVPDMPGG